MRIMPFIQTGYAGAADAHKPAQNALTPDQEPPVVLTLGGNSRNGKNFYGPDGKPVSPAPEKLERAGKTGDKVNQPCQTCAERKYQDGSNDIGVSFKAPASIAPGAAGAVVRAHEQEHVSRAQAEAERNNLNVQTSVVVHTDICPECRRVYVAGGSTYIRMTAKPPNAAEQRERYASSVGSMLKRA